MGEIADAVLEGLLCEGCGEFIDDQPPGHPRNCSNCGDLTSRTVRSIKRVVGRERQAARENRQRHDAAKLRKPFACDQCPKLCRTAAGLVEHKKVKHQQGTP